MVPLHSGLGDKSETLSQKKKRKKKGNANPSGTILITEIAKEPPGKHIACSGAFPRTHSITTQDKTEEPVHGGEMLIRKNNLSANESNTCI
ncbi:hypothetical protein AAY473_038275 [Plecturocebus cupreus]